MEPLLRIINLSKQFGALRALDRVSLDVRPGEVIGLAGRSGSGKSVLVKILAGLHSPTTGDLYFDGRRFTAFRPHQARRLGIEVIHQEPELADWLDITSNIFLGSELSRPPLVRWLGWPNQKQMDAQAGRVLDQLGVRFDSLREKVANLSGEQRQVIAIARAMVRQARLIIVDEPLTGLSSPLQKKVLSLAQRWREQKIAVIIGSNNLDHLFAVTDRIIVLRHGRQVAERRTDETTQEEIVALLVGAPTHESVTPIIWALDSYYRAREKAEELQRNQALLQRDLAAQDTLNRQLLDQLAQQVAALDEANVALQDAQRRLLIEREQERKHLARELHDQLIQDLLGVGYQIEEILSDGESGPPAGLENMQSDVRHLIGDLRRICNDLRPPTLDGLGLGAAIRSHAQEWANRHDIALTLNLDPNLGRLPEATELSIFRIAQEGLNNVRQHALASSVSLTLEHTSPRTLMLAIADDGRGLAGDFDLSALAADSHFGLLGISERVALLGGRLQLQNQPGGGLLLTAEIPHPRVQPSFRE